MDQTLDSRCDLDEGTIVGHDDNLALDLVANLEVGIQSLPRMGRKLLQTQSNTLLLLVEVDDNDLELLVQMNDLLGVVYAAP